MIADEDDIDNVKVTVQYGLKHGNLVIPESRSYFTVSDLREGGVRYRHDDTDTLTDNIIFKVSDGRNEVRLMQITMEHKYIRCIHVRGFCFPLMSYTLW